MGERSDHQGIGLGQTLQACGDVGRLADDGHLRPGIGAPHLAGHHQTGVHADTHRHGNGFFGLQPGVEARDRLQYAQSGARRALGVILVGSRVAEVNHQSVAEGLRDVAFEFSDFRGAGVLVGPHHVAQLLRVQPLGKGCRAHHVAEHHSDLTAFGFRRCRWSGALLDLGSLGSLVSNVRGGRWCR